MKSENKELTVEDLGNQDIEFRRKQAILSLRKSFGSAKPRPRLTREQKEMIAETSLSRAKEIAKKYGVDDIAI